jgi:glucose/arabinose dehydrogenase
MPILQVDRLRYLIAIGIGLLAFDLALASGATERTGVTVTVAGVAHQAEVPAGYRLELLTDALETPRLLTFAPDGDLFIGSKAGRVYRLAPPYRQPTVFADIGGYPHSVAFRPHEILIAKTDGVYHASYTPGRPPLQPGELQLLAALPKGGGHSSRSVGVGPDGRVYVSLGISGNCSNEYLGDDYPFEARRGGVLVLDEGGTKPIWSTFASGLRNAVGFDWQPGTGTLYASNNGPDHWGFDLPGEYFTRLDPGSFHGMPWFQFDGRTLRRDDCIRTPSPRPASDVPEPVATFPARNAPMGVAFVPQGALEPDLQGDAVVALRGSWGTRPDGSASGDPATRRKPKLVLVRFGAGEVRGVDDLVTGFQLPNGARWARPVGVAFGPDGALYFTSDSGAQALFRLHRDANLRGEAP